MTIKNMHKKTNQISISKGCSTLGVSNGSDRSRFTTQIPEMKLKNEIQAIATDFPDIGTEDNNRVGPTWI